MLEEGDSAEIEFLGIHTFFPHCVMFSTLSFAVLYSVIRKQYPAHFFFFPFFSFLPGGMDVGALTEANALSLSAAEVLTGESNCKLQK